MVAMARRRERAHTASSVSASAEEVFGTTQGAKFCVTDQVSDYTKKFIVITTPLNMHHC